MTKSGRLSVIRSIVNFPPQVHASTGGPNGVWRAEEDCYRFLAAHCPPGTRTMETGLGISTALFAVWGAVHTCVVSTQGEVDIVTAYMDVNGIPHDRVDFMVGSSDVVLPKAVVDEPLDLFFIDGCHGFPFPIIDWFYGARWLHKGGILIVDDMHLPSVASLGLFLELDPRWVPLAGGKTWGAYRRDSEGELAEDWGSQPFLGSP